MFNIKNIIKNKTNTLVNDLGAKLVDSAANTLLKSVDAAVSGDVRVLKNSLQSFAGDAENALTQSANSLINNAIPDAVKGDVRNFLESTAPALPGSMAGQLNSLTAGNIGQLTTPAFDTASEFFGAVSQIIPINLPSSSPPGANARIGNPLEVYASYNTIFTLGVLSAAQVANPSSYRNNLSAVKTILRSGGGGFENRALTEYESSASRQVEYYIDDVEMDSLIAPSTSTGVSTGTKLEFKVIEPYSVGLFLEALKTAAEEAGWQNYTDADFLLAIEFKGWDENSTEPTLIENTSKYIPIRLLNIEFSVEQGGSVYECSALPSNDQSFLDEIQTVTTETNFTGPTLADALNNGPKSLTASLNERQQSMIDSSKLDATDMYLITFPNERTPVGSSSGTSDPGSATITANSCQAPTAIFDAMSGAAASDMNPIGNSKIVEDLNDSGENPFGNAGFTLENGVFKRNGIELSLSSTDRNYKFPKEMTIQEIIEEMVLISDYGRNTLNNPDKDGYVSWFKVESEVYPIDGTIAETIQGRKPRIFVYKVVPYKVHASKFATPDGPAPNVSNLKTQVVKEYEYLYTGKNKDIIRFDLEFKTAFFNTLNATQGHGSRGSMVLGPDNAVQTEETKPGMSNPIGAENQGKKTYPSTRTGTSPGGTSKSTAAEAIARDFHRSILDGLDLLMADLEIWGDPFYLPDSGVGNYTAGRGPSVTINADGGMDWQNNEVHILINYRIPIDYNEATGLMEFREYQTFSGIYKITTVTHSFSSNKFTQSLKLLRVTNQEQESGIYVPTASTETPESAETTKQSRSPDGTTE